MNKYLTFSDINVNVTNKNNFTCHWYQKPTDTRIILKFRSCAPIQHTKIVNQVTVHIFITQHLIGWLSIRRLKQPRHAGPQNTIQMNGHQKL